MIRNHYRGGRALRKRRIDESYVDENATIVNDASCGDRLFIVGIQSGPGGYNIDTFAVWSDDDYVEGIVAPVICYLEREGNDRLFVDDYVEDEREEMELKGMDDEEIDMEIDKWTIYFDCTMEGAEEPHYIFGDTFRLEEVKDRDLIARYREETENMTNESLGHRSMAGTSLNEGYGDIGMPQIYDVLRKILEGVALINSKINPQDNRKIEPAYKKYKKSFGDF